MADRHMKFDNEAEPSCYSATMGANDDMGLSMFRLFASGKVGDDDYLPTDKIMVSYVIE